MIDNKISEKDIKEKQNKAVWHYFDEKRRNQIKQDMKAGREIRVYLEDDRYINMHWLKNCINRCCGGCGNKFTLDIDDN